VLQFIELRGAMFCSTQGFATHDGFLGSGRALPATDLLR